MPYLSPPPPRLHIHNLRFRVNATTPPSPRQDTKLPAAGDTREPRARALVHTDELRGGCVRTPQGGSFRPHTRPPRSASRRICRAYVSTPASR